VSNCGTWPPRPAADVLVREFGDEIVLLRLSDATFFGLMGVGAGLWRALLRNETIEAALLELGAQSQGPLLQLEQDVEALITALRAHRLILTDGHASAGEDSPAAAQTALQAAARVGLVRYGEAREFTDATPIRPGAASHR
jgi:coenzyme PQQ synthesis protein D (PqqD)